MFEPPDVFANHRLKSRWTLDTRNMALDANNLSDALYTHLQMDYLAGEQVLTLDSPMSSLEQQSHLFVRDDAIDSWRLDHLMNPRNYRLHTERIPTSVPVVENPILTLADLGFYAVDTPFRCLSLDVGYDNPVVTWDVDRTPLLLENNQNTVRLWQVTPPSDDDIYQERVLTANGITIKTSFYFAPVPAGNSSWEAIAGATAPLKRWDRTVIEGLTTEPIVLTGYYSQSYRPYHHAEEEYFLFEPGLEPGISPDILNQLALMDVRLIYMINVNVANGKEPDVSDITTFGFDDM